MAAAGLSPAQVEFFVEHNYVKLEDAVPPALCARWVAAACEAHGVNPADEATWGDAEDSWRPQKFLDIRHELSSPMQEAAPRLHAAINQLAGSGVLQAPHPLSSLSLDAAFVVNYNQGWDKPWVRSLSTPPTLPANTPNVAAPA